MLKHSIAELLEGLKQKHFSCLEVTEFFLQRIEKFNPELNALINITKQEALAAAKAYDSELNSKKKTNQNHPYQALAGIPIGHKDIFCTQGIRTSCGSKMLNNFVPPYDATLVEAFKQAGAICLGKTNMDEFAMGSSNENSFYGPVQNPWEIGRVPGGSSGGSAAAVAARLMPGCTGTDTGGSIRQPAALCGITGLKPTYGRVSRWGMIAFASSLDQAGPMAQSAEDAAILLQPMAGHDAKDSTSMNIPTENYLEATKKPWKKLRIGIVKDFLNDNLDSKMLAIFEETKKRFAELGADFIEIELPHAHLAIPAYYIIAPAECSSNLSRFDGVRYGYRCEKPTDLLDLYERSRSEAFGKEVKRRIMIGTYALSAGYFDAYYRKAQKIRRLIKNDFTAAFEKVDLILTPTTPTPAFKIDEKAADPVSMYLNDIYTVPANLAGLPAINFPSGFIDKLPVGMQLTSPAFTESRLLNATYHFQQLTDWHKQIPPGFE